MKFTGKNVLNIILKMLFVYICIELFSWLSYNLIYDKKCDLISKHEYKGSKKGKTLLIIGSVHGDEPAGHLALLVLKKKLDSGKIKINRGKIIIIPTPNYCGLQYNYRVRPGFIDINRGFPTTKNGKSSSINNKLIVKYIKESKPDFILDFHEAYYFHRRNLSSYGSYLITNKNCSGNVSNVAKKCKLNINRFIKEYYKKWDITNNIQNSEGSLRNYAKLHNMDYLLIETVGQRNMEKIEIRIKINLIIMKITMKSLNLI